MSEDKPWYQDGGAVFFLLIVAIFVGPPVYRWVIDGRPPFVEGTNARAYRSVAFLFEPAKLNAEVWHQHPGGLKNGTIKLYCHSDALKAPQGRQTETYSFTEWPPNEDNALRFSFPVKEASGDEIYKLHIEIDSEETLKTTSDFSWKNSQ